MNKIERLVKLAAEATEHFSEDELEKGTMKKLFASISPDFGPAFAFNAKDLKDAEKKMASWNRYHSFTFTDSKNYAEEIGDAELMDLNISIRNEYIF